MSPIDSTWWDCATLSFDTGPSTWLRARIYGIVGFQPIIPFFITVPALRYPALETGD
jgi:hypothetical protein